MSRAFSPVTLGSPRYSAVNVGGFRLTIASFPANARLPFHAHEHTVLSVILSGGFALSFERATHQCSAGTLFVEPSGERHADLLGPEGAQVLCIEVAPEAQESLLPQHRRLLSSPAAYHRPDVLAIGRRLGTLLQHEGSPPLLGIEEQVLDLLARASGIDYPSGSGASWLERIREQLDASPHALLLVSELARDAGVHRAHLGRAFRERFGVSLGEYHRSVRLRWAAEALASTDMPIGTIAVRAGFYDHGHFTRTFKRVMGTTPLEYRGLGAKELRS